MSFPADHPEVAAHRRLLRCAERVATVDASRTASDVERENALADLHAAQVDLWALCPESAA